MFVSFKVLLFIQNVNLFFKFIFKLWKNKILWNIYCMTWMYEENSNELVNFLWDFVLEALEV